MPSEHRSRLSADIAADARTGTLVFYEAANPAT